MCDVSLGFPVSRAEFQLLVSRRMPMGENPREHTVQTGSVIARDYGVSNLTLVRDQQKS